MKDEEYCEGYFVLAFLITVIFFVRNICRKKGEADVEKTFCYPI
jgi:hypothetical protein